MTTIPRKDDVHVHPVKYFKFPSPVVGGTDVGGERVVVLVVEAEQEAGPPAQLDGFEDRGESKVVPPVLHMMLHAPVGRCYVVR